MTPNQSKSFSSTDRTERRGLHAAIMNLPCKPESVPDTMAYALGHRDARHAAAELALESDAINAELLEALKKARDFADSVHDGEYGWSECTRDELVEQIDAAIEKATA